MCIQTDVGSAALAGSVGAYIILLYYDWVTQMAPPASDQRCRIL